MKPRIGVTGTPTIHDDRPVGEVNRAFTDAVAVAGAIPFVLPVLDGDDADEVVAGLDGLLLSEGGDVAAWHYGEETGPEACNVDASRDTWELALVAAARNAGLPILGVCRGAQVLNVAAGGSLVQHLPAVTDEPHRVRERDRETVHPVDVDPASVLAAVTGLHRFGVNSLHPQAVGRVGSGLRPVAWAPDGVVEAVESDDHLLLGVQWHPELLTDQLPHARLFAWLAEAAARRQELSVPVPRPEEPGGGPVADVVPLVDEVA
jgi:putative glutamine amidotransferase